MLKILSLSLLATMTLFAADEEVTETGMHGTLGGETAVLLDCIASKNIQPYGDYAKTKAKTRVRSFITQLVALPGTNILSGGESYAAGTCTRDAVITGIEACLDSIDFSTPLPQDTALHVIASFKQAIDMEIVQVVRIYIEGLLATDPHPLLNPAIGIPLSHQLRGLSRESFIDALRAVITE